MGHYQQLQLQAFADRVSARSVDLTRHRCFISYHAADIDEVTTFIDQFGTEFIAKTIGVTDEDDFIDSADSDYIMDRIRSKYLAQTTVTIVLVGQCTWARRYVDWEVYSSLRSSKLSGINGLLAIQLPSGGKLQARVDDNIVRNPDGDDVGYARWMAYPDSKASLRSWIGDAFHARVNRRHLIDNSRPRRLSSAVCP